MENFNISRTHDQMLFTPIEKFRGKYASGKRGRDDLHNLRVLLAARENNLYCSAFFIN
jgi:hypothetical protein